MRIYSFEQIGRLIIDGFSFSKVTNGHKLMLLNILPWQNLNIPL